MASLPIPTPDALAHSAQLSQLIQHAIVEHDDWLDFAGFMQMALYTPYLGYYSGGQQKFGKGGDFVTAPELSALFGGVVARQVAQVLAVSGGDVLELGAGTGKLALQVLQGLEALAILPERYYILDVSAHLRQVQIETLKSGLSQEMFGRVVWLDAMPEKLTGVVLGNEVLDALAVHVVVKRDGAWLERGVAFDGGFDWQDRPLRDASLVMALPNDLPEGYVTEVCPAANGLIATLAKCLQEGLLLFVDYGFGAREYYHPQRNQGTLMCHYQHYAHGDPFWQVGLQDITAHVNFTAIAETALAHGLGCAGYVNQAQFLINGGITELLQKTPVNLEDTHYLSTVSAVQKLLSPAEMGELFKVIALSKGLELPLIGFVQGDKRHAL